MSSSISFLITAHNDPVHLARLCARLQPHEVFVHWDAKSEPVPSVAGVQFLKDRVSVHWAGFSQVEATINLIRFALEKNPDAKKLVLLSGSCYPIKPLGELEHLFDRDQDRNYMRCVRVDDSDHLKTLTDKRHWRGSVFPVTLPSSKITVIAEKVVRRGLETLMNVAGPRPEPPFKRFHGSNWWAISRQAARYILETFDHNSRLTSYYKQSFASDEQFFHTLIYNSPLADNTFEIMPFTGRGVYKTANLHLIDPSLAKWYVATDFDALAASDKYFVRKTSTKLSTGLLDRIDRELLALTPPGFDR